MKEEIEKRLQLLITISLFFPVLLYNLHRITGQSDGEAIALSFKVTALAGLHILNYIVFEVRKDALSVKSLKRIGRWLLVAAGVFIVPIVGIPLSTMGGLGWFALPVAVVSGAALLSLLFVPPLIEIVILFSADRGKRQ